MPVAAVAELLRPADVRARVELGDRFCRMPGGGQIELTWHRLKPSTNNGPGWRLTLTCPACRRRNCRQLERRPPTWWRCCNCRHRTLESDERARRRKLRKAHRARLAARRAADGQADG
jgi:hypothetical protein